MITPDLCTVYYCYVAYLLDPSHTLLLLSDVPPPQPSPSVMVPHRVFCPPGHHPSLSQHTEKPSPAFPSPITSRDRLVLSFLILSMPVGLPSPPLSCCCRNIFNVAFICCSTAACYIPPTGVIVTVSFLVCLCALMGDVGFYSRAHVFHFA